MDNQKDTQKTSLTSYGQANVHTSGALPGLSAQASKPVFQFANKKTEKLVTALYMVTDCMETEDALKGRLRLLGVELLSDMYKLSISPLLEKSSHLSASIARVHELLSFVEIAYTIGYISEMNTMILKKEFAVLLFDLQAHDSKEKHFTFTLDEKMFDMTEKEGEAGATFSNKNPNNEASFIKDNQQDKRTTNNGLSFTPGSKFPLGDKSAIHKNRESNVLEKGDRVGKILAIVKDKMKSTNGGEHGVSIKDISSSFTNCSEKTIQRELNSLVSNNKLKKLGAKRWSRYQLI